MIVICYHEYDCAYRSNKNPEIVPPQVASAEAEVQTNSGGNQPDTSEDVVYDCRGTAEGQHSSGIGELDVLLTCMALTTMNIECVVDLAPTRARSVRLGSLGDILIRAWL